MRLKWVPVFLAQLREAPNVSAAARASGVSREAAYAYRDRNPEFAFQWDDALGESTDELIGELYRRARHGTRRPVFYLGEKCGAIREYSDTLGIFLAKSHRPEVYGTKVDVTSNGKTIKAYMGFEPDDV